MTRRRLALAGLVTAAVLLAAAVKPAAGQTDRTRQTLFVGVDTSGSFQKAGYDDAMTFLAHYLYGHLNGLGGLARPRELFVAAIGGREGDEPKAFRPIHDFVGKDVAQLEADLRQWFPARDTLTDFNAFFRQVARLARERNLLLTPITVMVVSDGVPDVPSTAARPGSPEAYATIDLSELEYLSRSVTVRLAYASPKVGDHWRRLVPRQRVRFWAVEREVMAGWRNQVAADVAPDGQARLWKWVKENVDYRVRRGI